MEDKLICPECKHNPIRNENIMLCDLCGCETEGKIFEE